MTHTDISKQTATVAANVIPFPDKLTRRPRTTTNKTGSRIFNLVLLQALRKAKERVLRRTRPANEIAGCHKNGGYSRSAITLSVRATA
jgi:hypothetical protein